MNDYIYSVVGAGVVTALIILLSPDGQAGKLGRYIAFTGALAMALVILSPIPSLVSETDLYGMEESFSGEKGFDGEGKKGEYLAGIAGMTLSELYGIEEDDIRALVYCNDTDEIERILLRINDEVFFDCSEAGEVLSEICDMKIEVEQYRGQ